MNRRLVCLGCLFLLLISSMGTAVPEAKAQEAAKRRRVGLALSGGSALGMAHIGVIKWFEENHIPIDAIAGTSMGGLVGGMYASGLDSDEMRKFVSVIQWQEVFTSGVQYSDMNFRRKEDLRDYPNRFELGLHKGFEVPPGLNPGQGVGLVISRITAPYSGMRSFDDLPTPFRCVGTDLVAAKETVFEAGDLFDALRATMSIPAYFSPVSQDKKVMVDGGTLHNIPVEAVQTMGADTIVAVELNDTMVEPYKPTSALNVLDRSIAVMILSNELRSLSHANLILSPDLKGLESLDFDKFDEFIRRGYAAAAKQAQTLKAFAVSEAEWQKYLAERRAKRRTLQITPSFVKIEGAVAGAESKVEKNLSVFTQGPLNPERLDKKLTRLAGQGRYDTANYRFVQSDGTTGLLVRLHQKPYGPPVLNTVLDIDGSDINNAIFGIGGRVTFYDFGGYNSEWRTDFNLGFRNLVQSEYYWRIHASPVFLAPRLFADYARQGLFQGNHRVAEYHKDRLGGGLDLGIVAGRSNEFRVGFESSFLDTFVSTGSPTLPNLTGWVHEFRAKWQLEAVDKTPVPHNGVRASTEVRWVLSSPGVTGSYPVYESRVVIAREFTARNIFISSFSGGTTAGNTAFLPAFSLGGPFRLSALARDQIIGNNYYYGGLAYLRTLTKGQFSLFGTAYFMAGYEVGSTFNDVSQANPFNDGLTALVLETPLGAVMLGGSVGEQGNRRFFFRIGRLF